VAFAHQSACIHLHSQLPHYQSNSFLSNTSMKRVRNPLASNTYKKTGGYTSSPVGLPLGASLKAAVAAPVLLHAPHFSFQSHSLCARLTSNGCRLFANSFPCLSYANPPGTLLWSGQRIQAGRTPFPRASSTPLLFYLPYSPSLFGPWSTGHGSLLPGRHSLPPSETKGPPHTINRRSRILQTAIHSNHEVTLQ